MGFSERDRARFVDLVKMLSAAWGKTLTKETFGAYELGLSDLPIARIEVAIVRGIREGGDFMTSVSKLREFAGVVNSADRAQLAWGVLNRAMDRHLSYDSIAFSDPILNYVVRQNYSGWPKIRELRENDRATWDTVVSAQFKKAYAAAVANPPHASKCGHLPGVAESSNGSIEDMRRSFPHLSEATLANCGGVPVWIDCQLPEVQGLPSLPKPVELAHAIAAPAPQPMALPGPSVKRSQVDDAMKRLELKTAGESDDVDVAERRRKLDSLSRSENV